MAMDIKRLLRPFGRYRSLKYLVVMLVGVVIVGFLDENSIWSHLKNKQKIDALDREIEQYRKQYAADAEQLRRLDTDPKAIERIARERYFMKSDDEDIFVLSDDCQPITPTADETTDQD